MLLSQAGSDQFFENILHSQEKYAKLDDLNKSKKYGIITMSNEKNIFVTEIDLQLQDKLLHDLQNQDFAISKPPYTLFCGKKNGISCTLYQSGKIVVQGKEMKSFMEFYLEPEILKSFPYSYPKNDLDLTPRIGVDEAGKGDFFGPLCIAGVFASKKQIENLAKIGVKDSKTFSDKKILNLAKEIRTTVSHHVVKINPRRYNELYAKFQNLNSLLAWGHATAIENLHQLTGCADVIIDQFAAPHVVESALKQKSINLNLVQKTKGEQDIVVAAASILARESFLVGLNELERVYGRNLPKGASKAVIEAGKALVINMGKETLRDVAKLHFKTINSILSEDL